MPAHATTSSSSQSASASVERFFSHIGQSVTSVFSTPEASAHAHKHSRTHSVAKHRKNTKPAAPPAPGWGVPEGTVAANALAGADSTIRLIEWDGQKTTLDVGVHAARADWAAVLLNGSQLSEACQKNWVRPIENSTSCGVPGGQSTLALAWDRSRLPSAPGWKDFWDVARHPGRRGLRLSARTTLEIALLADGIDPRDIYTALSTHAGVDRAFHKLDLLRPYIVWWKTPDDAARIMEQSSALMTSAPMAEISSVSTKVKAGPASSLFVAQPDVVLRTSLYWAIPANTPNEVATKTLEHLNKTSLHLDDTPDSAVAPNGIILPVNEAFWTKYGDQLEQRFQDWYGSKQP
mgnify:FL=1